MKHKNVYLIGSENLTFEIIERIIFENMKLELAPEAKERIEKCRDYLDKKIDKYSHLHQQYTHNLHTVI